MNVFYNITTTEQLITTKSCSLQQPVFATRGSSHAALWSPPLRTLTWSPVKSGSEVKTVFWGHSWRNVGSECERADMKARTSHCSRPASFPSSTCQHIHYIWIQTELSNLHYGAFLFCSNCFSKCVQACWCIINAVFTHLERIYDEFHHRSCNCEWFPVRIVTFDLKLLPPTSCFNYKPYLSLMKALQQHVFWNEGWKQKQKTTFMRKIKAHLRLYTSPRR